MELESLPSITRLSERVVRVLGQNPGKFTLQGTNTYIIGQHRPFVLVDTGEGNGLYIDVLDDALNEMPDAKSDQPDISDIILSHRHHDHIGGLPTVLDLLHRRWTSQCPNAKYVGPRIHKFPISSDEDITSIMEDIPPEHYTAFKSSSPIHPLQDSQIITQANIHILHTPGHTTDSITMSFPGDNAIFTADTVLGQGTAVFEDLATYMSSLSKILSHTKSDQILYPGHGPVVPKGADLISTYIAHRTERENQILQLLGTREDLTTMGIVKILYKDYPESLHLPAARGVDLHLKKLLKEKRVKHLEGEGIEAKWEVPRKV